MYWKKHRKCRVPIRSLSRLSDLVIFRVAGRSGGNLPVFPTRSKWNGLWVCSSQLRGGDGIVEAIGLCYLPNVMPSSHQDRIAVQPLCKLLERGVREDNLDCRRQALEATILIEGIEASSTHKACR